MSPSDQPTVDAGLSLKAPEVLLYSLPSDTTFFDGFDRFAAEHIPDGSKVLDIGSGKGWPYEQVMAKASLVGVDPDPGIHSNPHLVARYNCRVEEMPLEHFDVGLASFVVEHVEDIPEFLSAVRARVDKFIFSTPNLRHYFGAVSKATHHLGAQEALLRLLGKDTAYHHPTYYRLNTPAAIQRAGAAAGFRRFEIAMFDNPEHLAWYFPKGLRWVPQKYSAMVYRRNWTRSMSTMFVVMS